MPMKRIVTLLVVFLVASPVAAISLWSIGHTAAELVNPCIAWNHPADQPVPVGARGACRGIEVNFESKTAAATRAAVFPGGLLAAATLAIVAAARARRRLMIASAALMLAETPFLFTIAPLTLIAGLTFLGLSRCVSASNSSLP